MHKTENADAMLRKAAARAAPMVLAGCDPQGDVIVVGRAPLAIDNVAIRLNQAQALALLASLAGQIAAAMSAGRPVPDSATPPADAS